MDDVRALLTDAPRFRRAAVTLRHWADRIFYLNVLERFRDIPAVAQTLQEAYGSPYWQGEEEDWWRVWLDRPFKWRVEERRRGTTTGVSGGDRDGDWQFIPREDLVYVNPDALSRSVGVLTPEGGRRLTESEFHTSDEMRPLFHIHLHPMVAELLDPGELFLVGDPDHPDAMPVVEPLGRETFLGRDVVRVRAIVDWSTRHGMDSENLWVADDYEVMLDCQTGVALRFACRADGEEFSLREMTEVAFDEPIDSALFEPPPGIKTSYY